MIRLGNKMNQYQKLVDNLTKLNLHNMAASIADYRQQVNDNQISFSEALLKLMINNFRTGDAQVLVSNPNTLGESISLHQTVHDAVYFEYNFNLTFMYSRAIVLIVWDYQQINILGTTT